MKKKLASLRKKYRQLVKQLGAPAAFQDFHETAQHDGSPHVEYEGDEFLYVVTERGTRYDERRTTDEDEILYWLIADVTWAMAMGYEVKNRVDGQDFRRLLFAKDIELMDGINPEWGQRKQNKYEKILRKHPYNDG